MSQTTNNCLMALNNIGQEFSGYAISMFIQSSVLIVVLLAIDFVLRKRVRAVFRYCLWMLVFVKLALPPTLSFPTGVGYWIGDMLPRQQSISQLISDTFVGEPATKPIAHHLYRIGVEMSAILPDQSPTGAVAPVGAAVSTLHLITWQTVVFLTWLAGVLILSVLLARRILSVKLLIAESTPAPGRMADVFTECCQRIGISRNIELRLSNEIASPAVCGLLRPVILMPSLLLQSLSQDRLRTVFNHELVHVKRGDLWVNSAQTVLQIVYFYNPFVWLANVLVRRVREQAVDEMVLVSLGTGARGYSNTLIDIAEMVFRRPTFSVSLRFIGIAESRKALERRITHMLNRRVPKRSKLGIAGLITVIAMGALLLPMGCGTSLQSTQQDLGQAVPELPDGIAELFDLNKDLILQKFGKPENIFYGDQRYTLENLPESYYLCFEDLSFHIHEDSIVEITLNSPRYAFSNGIRVGDSEAKVIAAFGSDYTLRKLEVKDLLEYEHLDLSFEIYKPQRKALEINIGRDYGDPVLMQAYARSNEFSTQLPQNIAKLDIDSANVDEVIRIFGEPLKYVWGPKTLDPDNLPDRFILVYPSSFRVFMYDGHIVEIRHEQGSDYVFEDTLHIGSSLEDVFAALGHPEEIIEGEEIDWGNSDNILYKDIDGRKGHCYYRVSDHNVRLWFGDYKIAAIYMTRSDYDDGPSRTPFDPEFARLLPERIAQLDIDTADMEEVIELFGEPLKYVWGNETFDRDNLPENFILCYPCDFNVWIRSNKIMEIRHERGAKYVFANRLHIDSTLEDALEVLGQPDEIIRGQENTFSDKVLYRDINGQEGHCYYHRADRNVRVWFWKDKVIAIYMTRSDFPAGKS